MKKLVKIGSQLVMFAIVIAASAMSGCNREIQTTPESSNVAVSINAGIDKGVATMASGVRDEQFRLNDEIGLYVVAYRKPDTEGKLEADGNYVDNAKSTKGAASWTNSPVIYYPTVKVDMYAYYPYSSTFTPSDSADKYSFTVLADQSSEAKVTKNDFMTAQLLGQASTSSAVDLTFFHRLSKLDVKFKIPATFKGKTIKSLQSVKFKNFNSSAVIDLTTHYTYTADGLTTTGGTYPKPAVANSTATMIDIQPNVVAAGTIGTDTTHYEAIVVPQTQPKAYGFVEIVVVYQDGKSEQFNYVAKNNIEFKAAHSTVIKLSFQPDNTILLGTVDIKGWEVTPPQQGEVTETEVFNTFTHTLATASSVQVTSVDITISQGTGTQVETVYTVPAKHTAGGVIVKFDFDGTVASPAYYPFKITKIVSRDAANTIVEDKDLTGTEVKVAGAISLT